MTKNKNSTFVTPVGMAKYAWLNQPDTTFANGGEGKYKIRVLIDDNEENRAWVANVIETAKADAKTNGLLIKKNFNNPFKFPEDLEPEEFEVQAGKERPKYDEDHKGKIFFEASSKFKAGQIDSGLQELPDDVLIMSGDKVRVKFQTNPYDTLSSGISLRLMIVQLVEKNSTFTGTGGINTEGFSPLENGFRATTKPALKGATSEQLASGDPDLQFFQNLVNK